MKKDKYYAIAENMYVEKFITVAEIAALHLPSLNRKLDPNVHHLPK